MNPNLPINKAVVLRIIGGFTRLVIGSLLVGSAVYISYYWLINPPRAQRRQLLPEAVLVETIIPIPQNEQVIISAMGTVIPAKEIKLTAQVAGRVIKVAPHFTPGSFFKTGDLILEIEPADYEITLKQQRSNLIRAEAALQLELGQYSVALKDYEILGQKVDKNDEELLLRKPQRATAEANVEAAKAGVEKAQLDLDRTVIRAPFNCVIQTRNIDIGGYVSPNTTVATLVGTDAFWIEVSLPIDELRWLNIPINSDENGSLARVFNEAAWGPTVYCEGKIIKLLPELDEGRMARILVEVLDPLAQNSNKEPNLFLLLGSYVRVELLGHTLSNVIKLPRSTIREGGVVWIMTSENTLDIRKISPIWSSPDAVFVEENVIRDGEKVVASNLSVPVPGMKLRTRSDSSSFNGESLSQNKIQDATSKK